MSDEDDWFERAIRDAEASGSRADDEAEPGEGETGDEPGEEGETEAAGEAGDDPFEDDDPFGGRRAGATDDATDRRNPGREPSATDTPADGVPADAFGDNADGSVAEDDLFGGYREPTGSDEEFGFGEFDGEAGDDTERFDVGPDEFDSSIERTNVGIEGLDDMILGGVPQRSLLSVIGGPGTGKTTFALQFLREALAAGRTGVYLTLEQTRESIFSTAEEKGWSFREHADEDRLAVVAIDPIEMANSLASIRNDLVRLIAEFDADRLVLDSVSLLEMMYDHPAKQRSEVFGFTRSLREAGVTTLLTSEASEDNPYVSRHGIVEYLTDAVFVLQYVRGSDFRETRLAVEIQKIRNANHSREMKPYDITDTGISVYDQANIF